MFETKKTSLFAQKTEPVKKLSEMNVFEKEKFASEHKTFSGNGSNKLTSTGNVLVDDFGSISIFRNPRKMSEIFNTMKKLWDADNLLCIKEMTYIRTITRDAKLPDGTKLGKQVGQGLKAEFFGRMMWLAIYHSEVFYKNLPVFIIAGSWDDIFELMRLDLSYEHDNGKLTVLDWKTLGAIIVAGLENPNESELVKKYLPTIKSKNKCTTLRSQCNNYIANYIANLLFPDTSDSASKQKKYRLLKTSGTAHEFQKLISQGKYKELNFNHIPGRVLGQMVKQRFTVTKNGKKVHSDGTSFLQRHGLEQSYEKWLDAQPVAKFTGYPYELFAELGTANKLRLKTIDKQFMGMIETAKQNMITNSNFIVCVDSSGSMTSRATGTNVTAYEVAVSMALYFSYLLTGRFAGTFLEFAYKTEIRTWTGNTPTEKFKTRMSGCCSNTDVLSVARLFVDLLKKGYPESDFPKGALLVSDGEFDRNYNSNYHDRWSRGSKSVGFETTFNTFINTLRSGGFSEEFCQEFKLVLWDIPNGYYGDSKPKFESLADAPNFFHMSGFDPAGICFLTGKRMKEDNSVVITPKTSEELFMAAMDQELLNMLTL